MRGVVANIHQWPSGRMLGRIAGKIGIAPGWVVFYNLALRAGFRSVLGLMGVSVYSGAPISSFCAVTPNGGYDSNSIPCRQHKWKTFASFAVILDVERGGNAGE
jgi:hypothetical protein